MPDCGRLLPSSSLLIQSEKASGTVGQFVACSQCDTVVNGTTRMNGETSPREQSLACPLCGGSCTTRKALQRHLMVDHRKSTLVRTVLASREATDTTTGVSDVKPTHN
ncbi:DUF7837 family putative zinc-binding protein [Halogranum amylolyticum]